MKDYLNIKKVSGYGNRFVAPEICICPECGHEKEKERGKPCMDQLCPKCGNLMMRGA